ncbi:biopolymer transporter ExbB [Szabonella alba]|uniref:Biopolymer transporter ExbB n=1 Tax=Szabonella alba TaxID=2804194 RepID=A0A8K0Y026_9RHOB|nr:biopolymer transporter ExbB [Szabonella alba]MBL4916397.1 biopolymer transporter ExbB [Szabonella alba]
MDRTTTAEAEPSFTQPIRQIVLMLIVGGLVIAGAWVVWARVADVFLANIWLNGFIGCVFVLGVLACFWQVWQLMQSVLWIEQVARRTDQSLVAPRLLAPLAALLRSRGARMQISATSARSILDSVGTRIDEARDITRYIVNLLIFLGLLGTFYGLATTVPAVVDTIRNLAPQEGETGLQVFDKLMGGLEAQLGGMGTAFSSSLLGLAGSLVVGLLELFAGHGQNRFYRELEEWLSSITRFGFIAGDAEGAAEGAGAGDSGAMVAVLDRMARQMEGLQALQSGAEAGRARLEERLDVLAQALLQFSDSNAVGTGHMEQLVALAAERGAAQDRLAGAQEDLAARLAKLAEEGGTDAESRMRLRSIDVQLLRILEELSAGRQESVTDLRGDIAALTTAVRQLTRSAAPRA